MLYRYQEGLHLPNIWLSVVFYTPVKLILLRGRKTKWVTGKDLILKL